MMKANKGSSGACLALLGYRNTPTQGLDTSPVERFKSRRTKTLLPSIIRLLQPQIPDGQHEKMLSNQERQANNYSRGARTLSDFKPGDTVRMYRGPSKTKDQELLKAAVNSKVGSRSNNVVTEDGRKFRRIRVHLRKSQEEYQPGRETTPLTNEFKKSIPQSNPHSVLTQSPVTNRLPAVTSSDTQGHQTPSPPPAQSNASDINPGNQYPTTR